MIENWMNDAIKSGPCAVTILPILGMHSEAKKDEMILATLRWDIPVHNTVWRISRIHIV